MRSNNNCSFLVFFFLLLFMILDSVDVAVPSYCQRSCGGIDIPYPFGIGVGCYLEKWYEIECYTSISGNFVPYLSYYRKELVNISLPMRIKYKEDPLPYGSVRIKNPITSKGCSSYEEESRSLLNLTGSPFYVGYSNTLIGLGCDNTVSLTNVKPNMVGCKSSCSITNVQTLTKEDYLTSIDCNTKTLMAGEYITSGRCSNAKLLNVTSCDGIRCCKASMPGGVQQVVGVKIDDTNTTTRGCKVAFLTAQSYALFNESSPQQIHAIGSSIVELGWFIRTSNKSFIESLRCKNITKYRARLRTGDYETSCLCDYNDNLSYASCTCARGYRGSPYLPYGCKDINECLEVVDGLIAYCGDRSTCVNTQGSFRCVNTDRRPLVVGLCVGFGSLILIGGIYWLYKFIRKQRNIKLKKKFFKRNGGLLLQQQLISTKGNVEKTKVYNSRELEKATENFSLNRILGQGGHGTVYKGMLSDGRIVAVKKSKVVDEDQLEEFINEVVILSQINHRNIVKLLGCCLETDVPVLVYEFISNGNLFEHLHDEFDDYMMTTWEVRLRIAIDIAGALSYLHSAASSPIYHRDIKSTNIMLDEKYRAKVSDFGTSRSVTIDHTHLTTVVSGTMGYMDPEYFQSSQFTDKSDVYSFGVVLVELITAEKSICYLRSQENRTLATFFILAMKENKLFDIIDTRIRDGCNLEQVIAVAQIARKCLSLKGKKRPNMREVCMGLERIRSSSEDAQPLGSVSENEDEENDKGTLEVNMRLESTKNVVFTAPTCHHNIAGESFSSWSDVEPLFPLHTQ